MAFPIPWLKNMQVRKMNQNRRREDEKDNKKNNAFIMCNCFYDDRMQQYRERRPADR